MENKIPYQVIKQITNNYDKTRILGSGGFGTVYKGVHENGETVAVKVFDGLRFDDIDFRKEFNNLKRLKHQNIVELVGFCNDTEEVHAEDNGKQVTAEKLHMALCLEYLQNGHLGNYISDESMGLHWHTRYKIIKGVCEGLKYLHDGVNPQILHLDLKPENILLGKDMVPKVADFGLSRLFGEERTRKTTSTCGTIGYVPPEYRELQVISEKYDIYSLGVIMVKTITGSEHFFRIVDVPRKKFINQVLDNWRKRLRKNLMSGSFEVYCQQIRRCTELALDCMKKNRQERPTIQHIILSLMETEIMIGNPGLNMEQFPLEEFIIPKMGIPEYPSPDVRELRLNFLECITDNFSDERRLDQQEFRTVYKGILEDGQWISVVKFEPSSPPARDRAFTTKIRSLSAACDHENIVKIFAYCHEEQNKLTLIAGRYRIGVFSQVLLCHDFFGAGSLAGYIYGESRQHDWNMNFKIIMGICQGLQFLHEGFHTPIIHTDLKPENILFDNNMVPKILFLGYPGRSDGHTPTVIYSRGHMAPEYFYHGDFSTRTDIYSLGIIILEIIAGARNHHTFDQKQARGYIENVRENFTNEYITSTYPSVDAVHSDHIKICIEIGLKCVELEQWKRPSIVEIVDKLNALSKEEIVVQSELLELHPRELCFPFEPKKPIYSSLQLRNNGDDDVAFMVVSKTPKRYLTKLPLCGVVPPSCTYTHTITMRKQPQQPCGEFFTLHRVVVGKFDLQDLDKGSIVEEYQKFFNEAKERSGGHEVQEVTLAVNCDPPVQERIQSTIEVITTNNAQQVSSIDVHPTEPWIMTTSKGSLHVWNYKKMKKLSLFEEDIEESVHVAKFVERENWLVAGDANGGIHVYSYDEREEVKFLQAHNRCITSLALHPTRPFLLSSSEDQDHLIKLWNWDKNNKWQCTRTFTGHADKVTQVIFNSSSTGCFTSASLDGTVKIWSIDEDDGDIVTLDGKDGGLFCIDNFERGNRQHLIAGCMHRTAQIWNMEIKGCVQRLEGHTGRITAVSLHPELPILITGSFDGTVRLWNSNTYQLDDIIDFNLGEVNAFGFIKDLKRIVVGCQQGIAMMEIPMR